MILTLLILINLSRSVPLQQTAFLDQKAQSRAEYLCTHEFSHAGWEKWWTEVEEGVFGENLAKGFENDVSAYIAFMNSKTHKDNIVNKKYTKIGIGRACDDKVIVTLFSNNTK